MGYAARARGTYEERKAAAIAKREAEYDRLAAEYDRLAAERERVFLSDSRPTPALTALLAAVSMGGLLR